MIEIPKQPDNKCNKPLGALPHLVVMLAMVVALILAGCAIADVANHAVIEACVGVTNGH